MNLPHGTLKIKSLFQNLAQHIAPSGYICKPKTRLINGHHLSLNILKVKDRVPCKTPYSLRKTIKHITVSNSTHFFQVLLHRTEQGHAQPNLLSQFLAEAL